LYQAGALHSKGPKTTGFAPFSIVPLKQMLTYRILVHSTFYWGRTLEEDFGFLSPKQLDAFFYKIDVWSFV